MSPSKPKLLSLPFTTLHHLAQSSPSVLLPQLYASSCHTEHLHFRVAAIFSVLLLGFAHAVPSACNAISPILPFVWVIPTHPSIPASSIHGSLP